MPSALSTSCFGRFGALSPPAAAASDRSAQLLRIARQDLRSRTMRPSSSSKIPLATTLRPPGNSQVTVAAARSLARDRVLHRRLDAGAGAVLEHALEHVLAVPDARRARRVVAVDLDQLDLVGVEREQRLDVPLLVAAPERVEIERGAGLTVMLSSLVAVDFDRAATTMGLEPSASSQGRPRWTTVLN